jgi:hypothetical protein
MASPPEARQLIRQRSYAVSLLSCNAWLAKAEELLGAAALLELQVLAVWQSRRASSESIGLPAGILEIHLMLLAYAVENIFKAALVKARTQEFRDEFERTSRLPNELRKRGHRLIDLAQSVGFNPTRDEEGLLRKSTRASRWSGRYPVPVKLRERETSEVFRDGTSWPTAFNFRTDIDQVKDLILKIKRDLSLGAAQHPAAPDGRE